MNSKSKASFRVAQQRMNELSLHPVLQQHWDHLALVLKGSTARGNADRYSDIDLVFFCPDGIKDEIVRGYREAGFCDRLDGIFIFFPEGHYHIETLTRLEGYFSGKDFIHCWEFQHAIALTDPDLRYAHTVRNGLDGLFGDRLGIVKQAYLDLQLQLDWMRMPIMRGDRLATFLLAARLLQGICRAAYLLDGQPFPPDKWLAHYLPGTRFGRAHATSIQNYLSLCTRPLEVIKDQPFSEHALYRDANELLTRIASAIRRSDGEQPWLEPWYDYV